MVDIRWERGVIMLDEQNIEFKGLEVLFFGNMCG